MQGSGPLGQSQQLQHLGMPSGMKDGLKPSVNPSTQQPHFTNPFGYSPAEPHQQPQAGFHHVNPWPSYIQGQEQSELPQATSLPHLAPAPREEPRADSHHDYVEMQLCANFGHYVPSGRWDVDITSGKQVWRLM
ncbi:uncharacterized protein BDZ99DRAFT_43228 [Mytilinidion resinicola]|uniref:Uncharacterized protein n=1 Tax=Mytilinidion resinicola TaxID=574789 RepID=A0A6A6YJE1_9PEZI|nr:uncharacterized protein BDZ99DRAFT_43228 [Mytilinidion resinicola]KAF2808976.1 hypothetical protein BDZ99DRAFT_43228 [Mytilinidion resinicola]